ncbi:sugar ABC transporter substrate-binding protein [Feifania hominis]|uniref:Sugar ABC transporter substrate-binding protein n=1 Tax=Feifania hominis TaxID=2763660 RepID=A0A926HUH3_9FIRM|nr:sugar ABC transporter substrate-binding protein [Feifania hominis]MBC8536914.1 sugar ABC transporter substrate-binding protein [Feifania hominis]
MKSAKRVLAVLLSIAMLSMMLLSVTGCKPAESDPGTADPGTSDPGTTDPGTADPGAEQKKLKIVFTITHQNNEFTVGMGEEFLAEGARRGHDVSLVNANLDSALQVSQMETAVTQGADAIAVFSVNVSSLGAGLQAAKNAGVPVFTIHSGVDDESLRVAHIGSNLVEGGKMKTEQMIRDLQEKYPDATDIEIGSMLGGIGAQTQIDITEGECQALGYTYSATPKYPIATSADERIKIVVQDTGSWQGPAAADLAEVWLDSYPGIKAINCNNDGMALGIWPILQAKNRTDVLLYGHDGTPTTLQAIKDGKMAGTAKVDIEGMIKALYDSIEANAAGENVESVQYILPDLVTPENVDEYLK